MTACTKPVRRKCRAHVPHGVTDQIVVTIYPGGCIGLRELRRRKEYVLEVGELYVQAIHAEVRGRVKLKKAKDRPSEAELARLRKQDLTDHAYDANMFFVKPADHLQAEDAELQAVLDAYIEGIRRIQTVLKERAYHRNRK